MTANRRSRFDMKPDGAASAGDHNLRLAPKGLVLLNTSEGKIVVVSVLPLGSADGNFKDSI